MSLFYLSLFLLFYLSMSKRHLQLRTPAPIFSSNLLLLEVFSIIRNDTSMLSVAQTILDSFFSNLYPSPSNTLGNLHSFIFKICIAEHHYNYKPRTSHHHSNPPICLLASLVLLKSFLNKFSAKQPQ